jgi:hypothetical protein
MATLRDALTSEAIAEGTPLQMVALADHIGRDHVLFDGVTEGFDPDEVLKAHTDRMEGLHEVLGSATGDDRTRVKESIAQADEEIKSALQGADEARSLLEQARSRHEPGHEDEEPEIPPNPDAAPQAPKETEPIHSEFQAAPDGTPKQISRATGKRK